MENHLEPSDKDIKLIAVVSILLIVVAWFVTLFVLKDRDGRGTFGDMFGSINALFSGLAFAGIILTILLQRKELSLQRQELRETRDELKRTADAQERSELALNRQAENLKISAELTALNTLVNYYYEEMKVAHRNGSSTFGQLHVKKERYVSRIEEILERKQ